MMADSRGSPTDEQCLLSDLVTETHIWALGRPMSPYSDIIWNIEELGIPVFEENGWYGSNKTVIINKE